MNSEKVKEIKKALECCINNKGCRFCARGNLPYDLDECRLVLTNDILTLINELESEKDNLYNLNQNLISDKQVLMHENERLKAEKQKVVKYMKTDNFAKLKKEDMYWGYQMGIGMLSHEIDRQKDQIAELEKENGELKQHITEVEKGIINIAKERNKKEELASKFIDCYYDSLKQFAEKLKRKAIRQQEFIGGLAIGSIEYVKTQDIDKTLKEFLKWLKNNLYFFWFLY